MRTKRRSLLNLFWLCHGWAPLLPLAFGLLVYWHSDFERERAERFETDGVVTMAVVVDRWQEVRRTSDGNRYSHFIAFHFDTWDGPWEGYNAVTRQRFNATRVGDEIEITYWRPDPAVTEIEPGSTAWSASVFVWISAAIIGLSLTALGYFVRETARLLNLRQHGDLVEVSIKDVKYKKKSTGDAYRTLIWDMEEFGECRSAPHPAESLAHVTPGMLIRVYHDPEGKMAPWWEGDLGPR